MGNERTQDVPEHEVGDTGSIGGLWPPETSSHRRRKAIYDNFIESDQTFASYYKSFCDNVKGLSAREFKDGKLIPPTRIQFRAVVEADILRNSQVKTDIENYIEATIPLESGSFGHEPILIYMGANSNIRVPNPKDINTIRDNLKVAAGIKRRNLDEIFSRTFMNGYEVDILKERNENINVQIAQLYDRFGWNLDEVKKMLADPNNILSVARLGDRIVSSGIAEIAEVPINGKKLRMAEITEAATLNGHDGQGLYTAVSARLLVELTKRSIAKDIGGGELDLVFGECNGLSLGVLTVAKLQGRTFATEVGSRYGFPGSGILYQQVPIRGAERNTEFNDLIPAFLTRSKLYEYYTV